VSAEVFINEKGGMQGRWPDQTSRVVSNEVREAEPSFCFLSCSILSSASLRRVSQVLSKALPSSNLARSSARGTSPDSIDSTMDSRRARASSKEGVGLVLSLTTRQRCGRRRGFQSNFGYQATGQIRRRARRPGSGYFYFSSILKQLVRAAGARIALIPRFSSRALEPNSFEMDTSYACAINLMDSVRCPDERAGLF
jgi:hypothetical protein